MFGCQGKISVIEGTKRSFIKFVRLSREQNVRLSNLFGYRGKSDVWLSREIRRSVIEGLQYNVFWTSRYKRFTHTPTSCVQGLSMCGLEKLTI